MSNQKELEAEITKFFSCSEARAMEQHEARMAEVRRVVVWLLVTIVLCIMHVGLAVALLVLGGSQ